MAVKENNQVHIEVPGGETTVLLHTCCAPCSSAIIEAMLKNGITPVIYYCNPNIYPLEEYEIRKNECTRYAQSLGLEIVDADYAHEDWLEAVKGLENEPERGERCYKCYNLRLEETAKVADELGFDFFATTLTLSPYKKADWLNEIGSCLDKKYNSTYLYSDFKKKNGYKRSIELSYQYDMYRQDYCGCVYSKRDYLDRKKNTSD